MKFPRYLQLITTVSLLMYASVESLTAEEALNNPNCTCTNGRCICPRTSTRIYRRINSTGNFDGTYGFGDFETGNDDDSPMTPAPTEPPPTTPEPTEPPTTTTPEPEPTEPPPEPEPIEPPLPDVTGPEPWQPAPPPDAFPNVFVPRWSGNGKTYTFRMSFNQGGSGMGQSNGNFPPSPNNIQITTGNQGNGLNSGFSGSWTTFGNGVAPSGSNFIGTSGFMPGGGNNLDANITPGGGNTFGIAMNNGETSGTGNVPSFNGQNFGFNNGQNFENNDGQNFENNDGQNFGFNNGQNFAFNNGQNEGFNNGQNGGFNNGQNIGFDNGQNGGFDNGQNGGFDNGQNVGFNNGQNVGFNNGQNVGFNNGQNVGFNNGLSFGFNNGQNLGFNNGFSKATAFASAGTNDSLMPKLFPNFGFGAVKPFGMNFQPNGFQMPQQQSFLSGMIPFKTHGMPLNAVSPSPVATEGGDGDELPQDAEENDPLDGFR